MKLLIALLLMFVSYLSFTLFSMLLALPLYSLSWAELNRTLATGMMDANIALIKYFQVTQTIGLFLIPALLLNYLVFSGEERFISTKVVHRPLFIILIIICSLIVSIPLISKFVEWNSAIRFPVWAEGLEAVIKKMEDERNDLTLRMLEGGQMQDLLFNIFMIAVLPALGEEFVFRGVLQQLLAKWMRNIHVAIVVSAFLFSAIHFQFYGFVPRLLLGIYFGYLFYWGKNIWWAVLAHFINNALAVLFLFVDQAESPVLPEILKEGYRANSLEVIISLSLTIVLISFLWKYFRGKQELTMRNP